MKITTYSATAAGKKAVETLGTQGALVMSTLIKGEPITSKDLTTAVEKTKKLQTRQPVARVVAYYLQSFKADGWVKTSVKTVDKEGAPAKKTAAKKTSKATKVTEITAATTAA